MKLFDAIRKSNRIIISDEQWTMDTSTARFTAQLSSPHIRLTKVLSIDNREHYLQLFISDQDIEIDNNGSAQVTVFVVEANSISLLPVHKEVNTEETFKFIFYKEVLLTDEQCNDSKNYRWLIEKATQTGAFRFNSVNGSIEVCDDSTATELDQDITQMRELEQEESKTN